MVVNDLVFTATFDGTIYAFNRTDGAQVWTYKAPSAINGWPAVAGDTIVWPAGGGGTFGNNTTPQLSPSAFQAAATRRHRRRREPRRPERPR